MNVTPDFLLKVACFLGGALLTLVGSYFLFSRDVSQKLAFLQGQMVMILNQLHVVGKLKDRLLVVEKDLAKSQVDLNVSYDKIRHLERKHDITRAS